RASFPAMTGEWKPRWTGADTWGWSVNVPIGTPAGHPPERVDPMVRRWRRGAARARSSRVRIVGAAEERRGARRARSDMQVGVDALEVAPNGFEADAHRLGDVLVDAAARDIAAHLLLAGRPVFRVARGAAAALEGLDDFA